MALKTITFTVKADKTLSLADGSHATIQDGGMQGDHKATALEFKLDGLYSYLQTEASNGKLVYRFDAYDGQGGVHHSDTEKLTGKSVTYPLEYTVTCHGGLVKVELIISRIEEKIIENKKVEYVTNEVLHTKAAELKLTFSPYSTGDKSQPYKDLSTLAEVAKQNAEKAEAAAAEAKSAQQQTENAKTAFQNGTTYIFNGGNASGVIDANFIFIVDTELSDYSTNAVENKAIKKYVDDKYPVGSIWIGGKNGSEPIDPSAIFGGEWKVIDKGFEHSARIINFNEDIGILGYGGKHGYNTCYDKNAIDEMEIYCHRADHTVRFRINCKLKAGYKFTDKEIAPFIEMDWKEFGFTQLSAGYSAILASNDWFHPAGLVIKVEYDNTIIHLDVMGSSKEYTVPNNVTEPITIDFTTPINTEFMLNKFCDKFYWQRTN